MKVLTIVGARPQFVKAAAVSRAITASEGLTEVVVHTGQHYDPALSQIFFTELGIPEPKYNLEIGSSSHGDQTGRMLAAIEPVPYATLRDETEWVELLETGWNVLQPPTSSGGISKTILERLDSKGAAVQLYGGGHASEEIVRHLLEYEAGTGESKMQGHTA